MTTSNLNPVGQFDGKDPWPWYVPAPDLAEQWGSRAGQAHGKHTVAFEQRGFGGAELAATVTVIGGLDES
ncbi:MAG TPA: hypothetical protein VF163_09070 [Micromonosporaceae bacterium]